MREHSNSSRLPQQLDCYECCSRIATPPCLPPISRVTQFKHLSLVPQLSVPYTGAGSLAEAHSRVRAGSDAGFFSRHFHCQLQASTCRTGRHACAHMPCARRRCSATCPSLALPLYQIHRRMRTHVRWATLHLRQHDGSATKQGQHWHQCWAPARGWQGLWWRDGRLHHISMYIEISMVIPSDPVLKSGGAQPNNRDRHTTIRPLLRNRNAARTVCAFAYSWS